MTGPAIAAAAQSRDAAAQQRTILDHEDVIDMAFPPEEENED